MTLSSEDKALKEKALRITAFALSQKAKDPVIIDLRKISYICDYFIIVSGESQPQVKAIYEEIVKKCKKEKITVHHTETDKTLQWMVVDLYDIVVHIFLDDVRAFYDVEHLWQEGKRITLPKKIL